MAKDLKAAEFMPKQVMNRHWVWVFLWCGAGILSASRIPESALWFAAVAGIAGIGVLVLPVTLSRRSHWGVALLCLALGSGVYGLRVSGQSSDALSRFALSWPKRPVTLEGTVESSRIFLNESGYMTFILRVDRLTDGVEVQPIQGKTVVRWTGADSPVFDGTRVRVTGRLSPHLGVVNHHVSGMEEYYRAQSVYSKCSVTGSKVERVAVNYWSPYYWASRLRQEQHERLSRVVPPSVYPFILGVWLGERSLITEEMNQAFVYSGTAHVLSVSGLHVAIIAFSLSFLLGLFHLPRRLQILLIMAGVLLFALMTGARPATNRSALMICLYYAAELFKREPDPLSVLGFSGFIFLSWNPRLLFDAGFLLSYGSIGSIMVFNPGLVQVLRRVPALIRLPLATTLSAQIVTAPLAAWYFYILPLFGILANLLVVPLLSAVLYLCLAVNISMLIFTPLAVLLGHALLPVVNAVDLVNASIIRLPGAYAHVLRPNLLAAVLYGLAVCILFPLLYGTRYRWRKAMIVVVLIIASAVLWRPLWQPATVDFIDVGRGDATFVRTPGGTTFLVDGGDANERSDAGKRVITPFLYANGIDRLDYLVVSHGDGDHIGGLFYILERFPVGAVYMGPDEGERSDLEKAFVEKCRELDISVIRLAQGDGIPAEGAEISVIHPARDWAARQDINEQSLVLHVSWPGLSLLLAGDIEEKAERQLLPFLDRTASILKVPHHGSPTSSSEDFLERVNPSLAIAFVEAAGSRGTLMTPDMTARYEKQGITLLRTDWHGGVRIRPSGDGYRVTTARGERGYSLKPATSP